MSFPRYPAYKDSGVEWLGEVPEHWKEKPLKTVTSINDEVLSESVSTDHEIEYVDISSVSLMNGIERTESMIFGDAPSRARRIPRDGDVLVSTVRTYLKAIAPVVSPPSNLVASTGFAVVRPQLGIHPGYLKYALQEEHFIQQVISRSTSVSYPAINASDIARIRLSLPNQFEQLAIATFLDRETAKIDALIAEQQRLIELLQEKRQAVISHAVTKGLNPDAPMKDSGVEWLGEVPEHWIVTQLRHFTRSLPGFAFSSEGFIQDESKWKLLRGVNVGVSCIRWDDTVYWDRQVDDRLDQYVLSPGDLVVGLDRPMIKEGLRVARIAQEDCPCMLLQRVAAVKGTKNLSTDYLFFLLSSPYFLAHFEPETTGVSVPHISTGQIDSFVVPIPPPHEQAEVVAFLSVELKAIQRLTEESSRSISLLQERRSALISAAVTGQIDVRGLVPEASAA
jgi:type I restriction enzyme S subunit